MPTSRAPQMVALAGWIAPCFAAAAIGGLAGPGAWYRGINKPACNPPDWLFGPVWTLLYTVMGVAAWIVWRRRHET